MRGFKVECHLKEISKTGLNVYLPCGVCEKTIKSVSLRIPGRTRQNQAGGDTTQITDFAQLGTNAGFGE